MQNDTIINALSEKIERLEAENAHLKTQSVENALNKILGISPESIVNFDPENTSVFNRYSLVAMENLGEMKANILALKDKNERLEKWLSSHKERIDELEGENDVLEAANSLLNHMLTNFGDTERSELLSKIVELEKENARLVKENVGLWSEENPKWKNSVKDGTPVLKIGDFIMIRKMQGSFSFSDHEIDDETTKEKVYKEFLYGGEFDYFVFNLYENATN